MSTKSLSINSASGANSTQAQEQAVKSFSSSSSNLNNASEREQSSSLELPSVSIKGVANNVEVDVDNNEVEEFDLKDYALTHFDGSPAVYVGTYGKYASGSLRGVWLDLTTFADYDEFLAVCAYIHRDEADPEFMAQDFEGFPSEWYTEGFMSEREFDLIREFAELDDDEREAFEVYVAAFGSSRDDSTIFDNFREAYCGKWSNEEEYAEQLAEDCCMLEGAPEFLKSYFDYKAFASDLFIDDYYFDSGFVYRRM